MRSKTALALALATATAALTASTSALSVAHEVPDQPGPSLGRSALEVTRGPAWTARMQTTNITVVGHDDLGGGGLNADVWEHRGYAYVGVWSGTCPASGVKVVDVRRPSNPTMVSRLNNPRGTSAEDVVVRRVDTEWFTGDLAIVGIQTCDDPATSRAFRGLQFFDVSDPRRPRQLGRFKVPAGTVGCHEVDLMTHPGGKVLAGCANNLAELINGNDEVLVVDASDPTRARKVAGFAIGADLGVDPGDNPQNVGCAAVSFAHSVRFTNGGRRLFVSYWDYGTLRFRVLRSGALVGPDGRSDLAPPDEDADNHSMTLARAGRTMVVNQEDFSPECEGPFGGWGDAKVYNNGHGRNRLVSTFSTTNSRSQRTDGFYSVHNTEAAGRGRAQMFSSWYSDGIVWWSLADRDHPVMRGQFVPPPTEDPTGTFPPVPLVWGVYPDRSSDLIFASDINSGLWILRPTGLPRL